MEHNNLTFDELEAQMRAAENARDGALPPEPYIIARLDGRGFSRLTGKKFCKPFDERFHTLMLATMRYLMEQEAEISFAYKQSDEISLLFLPGTNSYNRKARKLLSLLPAMASAKFSLLLGEAVAFDCRLNLQNTPEQVANYFRWRSIDAERNASNAYAYWQLRHNGMEPDMAAETLRKLNHTARKALMEQLGIDMAGKPCWQTRGTCLYRRTTEHTGHNPLTGESTRYTRRSLQEEDYSPEILFRGAGLF